MHSYMIVATPPGPPAARQPRPLQLQAMARQLPNQEASQRWRKQRPSMIACLAIIGKKNDALFLETFVPEKDQLRFHYLVHSALDIYDERRMSRKGSGSSGSSTVDMYLGHLCPIEEFRLYGYLTSSQVKIIAVLTEGGPVRDADLRAVLVGVHQLYVNYVQCPFTPLVGRINSDRFRQGVTRQANLYNGV